MAGSPGGDLGSDRLPSGGAPGRLTRVRVASSTGAWWRCACDCRAIGEAVDPAAARLRADDSLPHPGFDLTGFEDPEVRSEQLAARTDRTLRYPMRGASAGPRVRYGIDVVFAGDRLAGFGSWIDDPDKSAFEQLLQVPTLFANLNFFSIFLVMPVIGFFFMRRYHAGERSACSGAVQIFVLSLIASAAMLAMCGRRPRVSSWLLLLPSCAGGLDLGRADDLRLLPAPGTDQRSELGGRRVVCRERWRQARRVRRALAAAVG